ncbi:citrulline utilization hydrolase CtlX [Arcicella lustrica]|uniref:Arginine deiminase-related protein n=1 Tax=Arcicella lustrica TaxID=2984196 RepID=A0ABU5SNJ5_9BACT|nr:arginine deiminase-related protein [Arcicella sp. DC25W]MEA5428883.1 arginine deiminase-related protein [Arcicella sp. DC25W]
MQNQTTAHILMIRPVRFGFNEQTATSNAFQNQAFGKETQASSQEIALKEFDEMVAQLRKAGVDIIVIEDTPNPHTPDSIFPNNWISFHNDGTVILYPMQAENRRLERREDIVNGLQEKFYVNKIIDLSSFEQEEKFLEGTGSMVLDRKNKIAYACISPRTHQEVLAEFALQTNYQIVAFEAVDGNGKQIYHTNVLMCVGGMFSVVCLEAVSDLDERLQLRNSLESNGKRIIEITLAQMNQFAGNMLEVRSEKGDKMLVMSNTAYYSLTSSQIKILEDYCTIHHFDLSMIEGNGGGSARCMMAEVHLPLK